MPPVSRGLETAKDRWQTLARPVIPFACFAKQERREQVVQEHLIDLVSNDIIPRVGGMLALSSSGLRGEQMSWCLGRQSLAKINQACSDPACVIWHVAFLDMKMTMLISRGLHREHFCGKEEAHAQA
eukprot:359108-Chlamydomonas_euryale.AAC.16